jgi:hypothetical protein
MKRELINVEIIKFNARYNSQVNSMMNRENDLKNLFDMCYETSIIKDVQLFKMLRYFLLILELKHW